LELRAAAPYLRDAMLERPVRSAYALLQLLLGRQPARVPSREMCLWLLMAVSAVRSSAAGASLLLEIGSAAGGGGGASR
jgi:hypothetical protein